MFTCCSLFSSIRRIRWHINRGAARDLFAFAINPCVYWARRKKASGKRRSVDGNCRARCVYLRSASIQFDLQRTTGQQLHNMHIKNYLNFISSIWLVCSTTARSSRIDEETRMVALRRFVENGKNGSDVMQLSNRIDDCEWKMSSISFASKQVRCH